MVNTMRPDRTFDGIADEFERWVYGTSRGAIRFQVIWTDLLTEVPDLGRGQLRVLDAGGGAGHLAVKLAALGNRVVLCDPSAEMLAKAEALATREGVAERLSIVRAGAQDISSEEYGTFDLITCHAVLEWVAEPKKVLEHLTELLNPGGRLSLMYYNEHAALFSTMLSGRVRQVLQDVQHGRSTRAWSAPGWTLLSSDGVHEWLRGSGMTVTSKAGVRMFHDYLPESARRDDSLEALHEIEVALRKKEPFASLAQHIHLVCSNDQQIC